MFQTPSGRAIPAVLQLDHDTGRPFVGGQRDARREEHDSCAVVRTQVIRKLIALRSPNRILAAS